MAPLVSILMGSDCKCTWLLYNLKKQIIVSVYLDYSDHDMCIHPHDDKDIHYYTIGHLLQLCP